MGPKPGLLWSSLVLLKATEMPVTSPQSDKSLWNIAGPAACLVRLVLPTKDLGIALPLLTSHLNIETEGKGKVKRWAHTTALNSISLSRVVSYFTYVGVEVHLTLISTLLNLNLSTGQPGAKTDLQTHYKRSLEASRTWASPALLYSECDGDTI